MGSLIKICGQRVSTSFRQQSEEEGNTVNRRGVRRQRAGLFKRQPVWESVVLSVH